MLVELPGVPGVAPENVLVVAARPPESDPTAVCVGVGGDGDDAKLQEHVLHVQVVHLEDDVGALDRQVPSDHQIPGDRPATHQGGVEARSAEAHPYTPMTVTS